MRFKHERPFNGQTRTQTKFLWFPRTINFETRWLEKASWVEVCRHYYYINSWTFSHYYWQVLKWVD